MYSIIVGCIISKSHNMTSSEYNEFWTTILENKEGLLALNTAFCPHVDRTVISIGPTHTKEALCEAYREYCNQYKLDYSLVQSVNEFVSSLFVAVKQHARYKQTSAFIKRHPDKQANDVLIQEEVTNER